MSPEPTDLKMGLNISHSPILYICSEGSRREGMSETMVAVKRQCSHTHNAGHALLLILICQRLMSEWNRDVRPTDV